MSIQFDFDNGLFTGSSNVGPPDSGVYLPSPAYLGFTARTGASRPSTVIPYVHNIHMP